MESEEGSGVTGLLITVILYISFFVFTCLLLHEYMVHIHKDARFNILYFLYNEL